MTASIGVWIPAYDLNWLEPIDQDSLFSAAFKSAESCRDISTVLAAVTPQTRAVCEAAVRRMDLPVKIVEIRNVPTPNPLTQLRFLMEIMKSAPTEWMAGPIPSFSTRFDPEAFQFAFQQVIQGRRLAALNGAITGWQLLVLHRSLSLKLPDLEHLLLKRVAVNLYQAFTQFKELYVPLIRPYREKMNKQSEEQPVNWNLIKGLFSGSSKSTLMAYKQMCNDLGVPFAGLNFKHITSYVKSADFRNSIKPFSMCLEISSVNDVPPIYSPLKHWERPERYPAHMPMEVFTRILSLAKNDYKSMIALHLSGIGEPMQNPHYIDMLKAVNEEARGENSLGEVHCYTDGRCLTEDIVTEILEGAVHSIMISQDAVDETHYQAVRPGGDFHAVTGNIERFLELKRKKPRFPEDAAIPPIVALTTTLIPELEDHIDAFMTSKMSRDRYMSRLGKNPTGEMREQTMRAFVKEGHGVEYLVIQGASTYAGQNSDHRLVIYTPLTRFACSRLTRTVFIKTDGSVVICDRILSPDPSSTIANVMDIESFQDVWKKLESKREAHRSSRYEEAGRLCGRCEDWFNPVD